MKTVFALLVMACFALETPATQATTHIESVCVLHASCEDPGLTGVGRIRMKNGNTFTIESDDSNTYFAEVTGSYVVGDFVLHSDPVNGWVEILGYAR